ncbi:MAG: HAMP domain-containing histidine kinase [Firmicutes bacterium]|nr:HAMP domain-containing histidine kinase [Bacillota bacterium]
MKDKDIKKLLLINGLTFLFFIISFLIFKNLSLVLFLLSLVCIFVINFLFIRKTYSKINSLSNYIDEIVKENYTINIDEYCMEDISNLKKDILKLSDKLKEKSELLEKEKKYLHELLEDISYQIKTPYKDANKKLKNNTDDKKEFLCRNKSQIDRIEMFIANLLKLSKLDSGYVKLKKEKIKISSLIAKSINPIKDKIQEKKINLVLNIKNIDVLVDVDWTSEALTNIINNACEHTKDEIIIESNSNDDFFEIKITNNGPDIKASDIPYIFERFYKCDKDSVGIGLSISKKIMEMQKGTIDVISRGKTTFIIKVYK